MQPTINVTIVIITPPKEPKDPFWRNFLAAHGLTPEKEAAMTREERIEFYSTLGYRYDLGDNNHAA